MFTTNHFIWLGLCALAIILGSIFAVKFKMKERVACSVMFVISLFSEISKMLCNMEECDGGFVLGPNALPLHMCSLLLFVEAAILFMKDGPLREKLKSFYTPVAIGGGILAMLIPTNGVNFLELKAYQCFVYHAGLVWLAFYFIGAKKVDLGFRSYIRNMVMMFLIALGSIYVNSILSVYETNFLYTRKPPMDNLPILNLDHGWPVYMLTLMAAGLVIFTAVQLPAMIAERKAKKKENVPSVGT